METHFKVLFILNLLKIWAAFQPKGFVQTEDFNEILIVFFRILCDRLARLLNLFVVILYLYYCKDDDESKPG